MRGPNRGRYVVAIGGPWRLYTHPVPGWQMLGTIQRGMDIGALAESQMRILCQVNAGVARSLDQRKTRAAIAAAPPQEPDMQTMPVGITIPDGVDFVDLKLARHTDNGDISFDWAPIERICEASSLDPAVFRDSHEGNVGGLIAAWYAQHLAAGGARDPVQDELIAEAALEDKHGGGLSHPPGRA